MSPAKNSETNPQPIRQRGSKGGPSKRSGSHRSEGVVGAPQGISPSRVAATGRVPIAWKWAISVAVVVHLLAVTAEPFRFFTRSERGTSPAADPLRWALAPYIELAYLNHGYFFFAPEPGPSHLIDCRLQMPDASEVSLTFPDKRKQWPRLLYHRHFMLAEFLHQLHVPPVDAVVVGADPQLAQAWRAEREVFERVRDSMSHHVASKFGASSARISRLEHRLPSDDEIFRQRLALDSPTLYLTLPDAPPTTVPPPPRLPSWGWQGMGVLLDPVPRTSVERDSMQPSLEVKPPLELESPPFAVEPVPSTPPVAIERGELQP